jgi:hypothetical protein
MGFTHGTQDATDEWDAESQFRVRSLGKILEPTLLKYKRPIDIKHVIRVMRSRVTRLEWRVECLEVIANAFKINWKI